MHVTILAAGLGRRLGCATEATSKAMIEIAGRPLVDYAVRFAERSGASQIVVVGGYRFDELERFLKHAHPGVTLVANPEFRAGNLLSLEAALTAVPRQCAYLVMNTDHIYRPSVADQVRETVRVAREVTAFCDFDRALGHDDMKVEVVAQRHVRSMSKRLERWDCGYVGMTFVPAGLASAHRRALQSVRLGGGEQAVVEEAVVELARMELAACIADISGHGWLEIDEPHEREQAERALASDPWWPA